MMPQRRRLATPTRAQERHELAARHLQLHVFDRGGLREFLLKVFDLEKGRSGPRMPILDALSAD